MALSPSPFHPFHFVRQIFEAHEWQQWRTSIDNNWRNELGQCAPVNLFQHTISYSDGVCLRNGTLAYILHPHSAKASHGVLSKFQIVCNLFHSLLNIYLFARIWIILAASMQHRRENGSHSLSMRYGICTPTHTLSSARSLRTYFFSSFFATSVTSGVVETIEASERKFINKTKERRAQTTPLANDTTKYKLQFMDFLVIHILIFGSTSCAA